MPEDYDDWVKTILKNGNHLWKFMVRAYGIHSDNKIMQRAVVNRAEIECTREDTGFLSVMALWARVV